MRRRQVLAALGASLALPVARADDGCPHVGDGRRICDAPDGSVRVDPPRTAVERPDVSLEFTLENDTEKSFGKGSGFRIVKRTSAGWRRLDLWPRPASFDWLEPGETETWPVRVDPDAYDFSVGSQTFSGAVFPAVGPGEYAVYAPGRLDPDGPDGSNGEVVTCIARFEVTGPSVDLEQTGLTPETTLVPDAESFSRIDPLGRHPLDLLYRLRATADKTVLRSPDRDVPVHEQETVVVRRVRADDPVPLLAEQLLQAPTVRDAVVALRKHDLETVRIETRSDPVDRTWTVLGILVPRSTGSLEDVAFEYDGTTFALERRWTWSD